MTCSLNFKLMKGEMLMGLGWSTSGFDRHFDEQRSHTVIPRYTGSGTPIAGIENSAT